MVKREKFFQVLSETKIIAVIRIDATADLAPTMRALYDGGVKIIEITSTSPGFLATIERLKEEFQSRDDVFVGAGTILDRATMEEAVAHNADFIVSPIFDRDIVLNCRKRGVPTMAGCMTPTEIFNAWSAGSDIIKTFPGRVCTPEFYKDIAGPFPNIKMMPTGNVNIQTAPEYIKAGAIAVGIGKALASKELIMQGDLQAITLNAKRYSSLLQGSGTGAQP